MKGNAYLGCDECASADLPCFEKVGDAAVHPGMLEALGQQAGGRPWRRPGFNFLSFTATVPPAFYGKALRLFLLLSLEKGIREDIKLETALYQ